MNRGAGLRAACATVTLAATSPAFAGPLGTAFTYQGQLKENDTLAPTKTYQVVFELYDSPDPLAGTLLGTVDPRAVQVTAGQFNGASVYYDSDNVGNETDTPMCPLEVVGAIIATNPDSSPEGSRIGFGPPSGDLGVVLNRGDGAGNVMQRWDIAVESNSALEIRDNTARADRFVINPVGNVGIGTASPDRKLTVAGT